MSKALCIYLLNPSTISSSCALLQEKKKIHQHDRDGFSFLLSLLSAIFPHLGGPIVDVVHEISSLALRKDETFNTLLHRFLDLHRKLTIAGHSVPPTALLKKYMDLIKQDSRIFPIISPIHRLFHRHLLTHGPDVHFHDYTIHEIHRYIKSSGIDVDSSIHGSHDSTSPKNVLPQAHAAALTFPGGSQPRPSIPLPSRDGSRSSTPRCPICFQRHVPLRCWARGDAFQPTWLKRNVTKYNALNPNDKIDEAYLNQPPPLRHAHARMSTADPSSLPLDPPQPSPVDDHMDSASVSSSECDYDICVTPSCNMATTGDDDGSFIKC